MKYLLLIILGYILYKLIKPNFLNKPANPHVKGDPAAENKERSINKKNIEDADFEDLE